MPLRSNSDQTIPSFIRACPNETNKPVYDITIRRSETHILLSFKGTSVPLHKLYKRYLFSVTVHRFNTLHRLRNTTPNNAYNTIYLSHPRKSPPHPRPLQPWSRHPISTSTHIPTSIISSSRPIHSQRLERFHQPLHRFNRPLSHSNTRSFRCS